MRPRTDGLVLGISLFSFLHCATAAVNTITAKGQYLFNSNGTQFFIRGVAYQQGVGVGGATQPGQTFTDSLADTTSCQRDIPYLQKLGVNTIRVYAIDPTADHTPCMNALSDAGIYVIADLSSPNESIERDSPAWNTALFSRYTAVIDTMTKYPNTLGFFAGNEVTNNNTNTAASAYVKAAVRDSKTYIQSRNLGRWVGVGYATNDDAGTRDDLATYFNCGNQSDAVDFWGYNIYEWCGQSTFQASGYEERTNAFQNYSVPAFFSEYGCNNPGGGSARVFQETGVLYSDQMNKVWSGGIVYEFFQEQNDFGLVSVSADGTATPQKDFTALASQVKASGYPAAPLQMASYTPTNSPRACPNVEKSTTRTWQAAEALPPSPDTAKCNSMIQTVSCMPSKTLAATELGNLFGTVCGLEPTACNDIASNATTGVYGQYSMCNATQQLAYAMNQYYVMQGKKSSACDFGGKAQLVTPTSDSTSSGGQASGAQVGTDGATTDGGSASSEVSKAAKGFAGTIRSALPLCGTALTVVAAGMVFV